METEQVHLGLARIQLVLFGNEVDRAAEARGIACGEQMLRRRGSRLAGAAQLFRHRKIG